jgi:hypothetical protein
MLCAWGPAAMLRFSSSPSTTRTSLRPAVRQARRPGRAVPTPRLPPWFDNARQLRALVTELENLTRRMIDNDPRWGSKWRLKSAEREWLPGRLVECHGLLGVVGHLAQPAVSRPKARRHGHQEHRGRDAHCFADSPARGSASPPGVTPHQDGPQPARSGRRSTPSRSVPAPPGSVPSPRPRTAPPPTASSPQPTPPAPGSTHIPAAARAPPPPARTPAAPRPSAGGPLVDCPRRAGRRRGPRRRDRARVRARAQRGRYGAAVVGCGPGGGRTHGAVGGWRGELQARVLLAAHRTGVGRDRHGQRTPDDRAGRPDAQLVPVDQAPERPRTAFDRVGRRAAPAILLMAADGMGSASWPRSSIRPRGSSRSPLRAIQRIGTRSRAASGVADRRS